MNLHIQRKAPRLFIFTLLFLFIATDSAASLKDIYLLRIKSNDFLKAKKFDSASFCLSIVIKDTTYANATDYMYLAGCRLQLNDTAGFKRHLIYSIEHGGADTVLIPRYCRSLDSIKQIYLKIFLTAVYPEYRAKFLKKIDPQIEREMKEIEYLDQVCRRQEDMLYNQQHHSDTTNSNFKHTKVIGNYIDSVNYDRVVDLIKRNKYPGFRNSGITANFIPLMHVSDHGEERWNFIFNFVKQQVKSGDMMPNTAVAIATRHFRTIGKCTYYGTIRDGLSTPCDCEHVDKFREEIGMDSLKQEYARLKQQLPDCYHE